MLAPDGPLATLSPLLLGLDAQGFRLDTEHGGTALEDALVNMRGTLHGVVAATDYAGAVETEDITGEDTGHAERQTDLVALLHEVGEAMNVDGNVVAWLSGEEGEQVADGVGDGGWGLGRVALLEGERTDVVGGGVGGVVDVLRRLLLLVEDGLDDGGGAVEGAGLLHQHL